MNDFNLIVTTQQKYENIAESEIWFQLLMLGDENPIIIQAPIGGILYVSTKLDPFEVINKLREIMEKDPKFFQYVLRFIPIQRVVETDLSLISDTVKNILEDPKNIDPAGAFSVEIKKRATNLSKKEIIAAVTDGIENEVNLKNPDWTIWIEIIGNTTAISVLKKTDIFRIVSEKRNSRK